jgi:hypothetical protein
MPTEATDPAELTEQEMTDALTAAAAIEAPTRAAAHHLLVCAGMPGRRDFAACVELSEEADKHSPNGGTVLVAYVDWVALERLLSGLRLNAAKERLLRLAVGYATGKPVDVRDIAAIGGDVHKRYVIEAALIATGAAQDELYVLSEGPGLQRNREFVANLLGD